MGCYSDVMLLDTVASRFGALLDMIADRASTSGLCAVLCALYPEHLFFFASTIALDIMSHFARVVSSLMANSKSHKDSVSSTPLLLRIYYSSRFVLTTLCLFHELFFWFLYLHAFNPNVGVLSIVDVKDWIPRWLRVELFDLGILRAASGRFPITICMVGALISAPFSFFKQFLSLVQLFHSSYEIVRLESSMSEDETESKKMK